MKKQLKALGIGFSFSFVALAFYGAILCGLLGRTVHVNLIALLLASYVIGRLYLDPK